MAAVKVYTRLIRGSDHVHSDTVGEGECLLFSAQLEADGHIIRTEHPDTAAWREAGFPEEAARPDEPWPQPKISFGEGFVILTIEHADDKTWEYLSSLDPDAAEWEEGSTREKFGLFVTEFEYVLQEPGSTLSRGGLVEKPSG